MEAYQIVFVVVGFLFLIALIFLKLKKKKKFWSIIQRIPIGDENGGWYAKHKFTGQTTKLYSSKKELFQNAK